MKQSPWAFIWDPKQNAINDPDRDLPLENSAIPWTTNYPQQPTPLRLQAIFGFFLTYIVWVILISQFHEYRGLSPNRCYQN